MATKKNIDLELADKFYEGVQNYVTKLENTREMLEQKKAEMSEQYADYDIEAYSALQNSGVEIDDNDETMSGFMQHSSATSYVKVLEEQEKRYVANKELLEKNIKVAIAKYMLQTEQDIQKAQKNRDSYEKYIKEEQEKLIELEEEIKGLEGNEEHAEVLKDKKEDYEAPKLKIEERLKKLEGYDKDLEELRAELDKNKEKYKDYLELANKDINEPVELEKTTSEDKEKTDNSEEPEKEDQDNDKGEDKQESEKGDKKGPEDNKQGEKANNGGTGAPVADGVAADNKEKPEEKVPETDEQAFNRIYKLLSKRKTRDSVTNEDIDKMIAILSDKDNYSKLNIGTRRFLDLGIFPSKAEKIYKQLGKKLAYDVYKVTKNNDVLSAANRAELAKWENINEYGVKVDEKTNAEIALDSALSTASDADREQIVAVKNRVEKYRQSMVTLDEVMFDRGELRFVNNELPAGNDEKTEYNDVNIFGDLESAVITEVTEPTSIEGNEAPSKTENIISDGHDEI